MTQRTRKLLGTIMVLLSIVVYSILIGAIYANFLANTPWWALLAYFAVAGALWFFPASWLVRWMSRPDGAGTR